MGNPDNRFEFTLFVLNIYYVLLARGIDGIRLRVWNNDVFREYMEKALEIRGMNDYIGRMSAGTHRMFVTVCG